jgi:hypothetical protein
MPPAMPQIATPEWVARFDRAVAAVDAGAVEVTVLHRIDGGGAWLITTTGGRVRVTVAGPDEPADLTFTWDADDAAAVARGDHGPLVPFQAGRLRVGGDLTRLAEVADLFARFPAVEGLGGA